jgi:hypothetical protein
VWVTGHPLPATTAVRSPLALRASRLADRGIRPRRSPRPHTEHRTEPLRRPRCRRSPLRPPLPAGQADQAGLAAAALGALRISPSCLPTNKPRPRRLPGAQEARALTHQGVPDELPQARPALLPHPARTRARGARTRHLTQLADRSAKLTTPSMAANLQASSRSFRDSRPPAVVHQRPSGRSRPPRNDPSTITSPAQGPSTQISPGIRGTNRSNSDLHNHSPPNDLTETPIQISDSDRVRAQCRRDQPRGEKPPPA